MCLIDGEIVALDHNGAPDFSTLQAAISDGKTDELIFFAFDLLFADGEDLRRAAACRAQGAIEAMLEARPKGKAESIRYVEHFEDDGEAVLQSARKAVAGRHRLEEAQLALSFRPLRELDQGQNPRRAGGRAGRLENHQRQIPFADGGRLSRRSSGLCRHRRHRLWAGHGQAHHAGAEGGGVRPKALRRQGRAAQDPRRALAEAGACRRNRIRRLDRWRQYPAGGVQGTAPGQAGRRGRGGETGHDQDRQTCRERNGKSGSRSKPGRGVEANPPK